MHCGNVEITVRYNYLTKISPRGKHCAKNEEKISYDNKVVINVDNSQKVFTISVRLTDCSLTWPFEK